MEKVRGKKLLTEEPIKRKNDLCSRASTYKRIYPMKIMPWIFSEKFEIICNENFVNCGILTRLVWWSWTVHLSRAYWALFNSQIDLIPFRHSWFAEQLWNKSSVSLTSRTVAQVADSRPVYSLPSLDTAPCRRWKVSSSCLHHTHIAMTTAQIQPAYTSADKAWRRRNVHV